MITRDDFIGTWRLLSYEAAWPEGRREFPFGADATGLLVYTREGYMSGQVMRRNHTSGAEYIAYCGPFDVDVAAGEVVHTVEASLYPKWVGSQQRRRFFFEGGRLTLSAPGKWQGETVLYTLVWEQVHCNHTLQQVLG